MPRYDYRCPSCGETERTHSIAACADSQFCDCGALLERLIATPTLHDRPAFEPGAVYDVPGRGSVSVPGSFGRDHPKYRTKWG